MNKLIHWVQNYLLLAIPFILTCSIWGSVSPQDQRFNETFLTKMLWEVLSWHLMLWFVALILFLVALVVFPEARENTLKRIANLKERDEREEFITGKASKSAYLATLSLLICLLFFSIFSLKIYHLPENKVVNGKTKNVEISLGLSLLDMPSVHTNTENQIIFESRDIPLSKSAILLGLILWQLGIFNFTARKENLKSLT